MREFSDYEDRFIINSRGWCFTSGRWKLAEGEYDPVCIRGETVLLKGVEVKVIGVETFCIPRSPSSPYQHSFGLMVSLEDGDKIP